MFLRTKSSSHKADVLPLKEATSQPTVVMVMSAAVVGVLLLGGIIYFKRVEHTVVDVI